jgi:SAM-dependent methyltransferase
MTMWKLAAAFIGLGVAGTGAVLYAGFGAFLPWREAAEVAKLTKLAGVREGQIVGEIGAGGGRFSLALAETVGARGRVYASELAGPSYDALSARLAGISNITVVRAEREKTNLPDACCDVVLMRNVYHHVTNPDRFLAAVKRALRPDGRVIVIDFGPGALWFHGGRPGDASERRPGHGVSQAAAAAEFEAAGFRLETSQPRWSRPMWLSLYGRID